MVLHHLVMLEALLVAVVVETVREVSVVIHQLF